MGRPTPSGSTPRTKNARELLFRREVDYPLRMRISLYAHGDTRIHLCDPGEETEEEELQLFETQEDVRRLLEDYRTDPAAVATLRRLLIGSTVSCDPCRASDEFVFAEVSRRIMDRRIQVLFREIPRVEFTELAEKVQEVTPAPASRPREAPAPEPRAAKCTNPACNPAFKEAARSGAAFVERSAPG